MNHQIKIVHSDGSETVHNDVLRVLLLEEKEIIMAIPKLLKRIIKMNEIKEWAIKNHINLSDIALCAADTPSVLELARKLKEDGIYSHNTYLNDIARKLVDYAKKITKE
jgi:hypothetical protein